MSIAQDSFVIAAEYCSTEQHIHRNSQYLKKRYFERSMHELQVIANLYELDVVIDQQSQACRVDLVPFQTCSCDMQILDRRA